MAFSGSGAVSETSQISLVISEDGAPEQLLVKPLGPDRFVLLQTPFFVDTEEWEVFFGDEIETELGTDGAHQFVRVTARGQFSHHTWTIPRYFAGSPEFEEYRSAVVEAGGEWESVFGGILFVHVPHDSTFDAEAELDLAIAAAGPGPHGS